MNSDIDKIKDILFGHEKKALDALTRRIDTVESRTADVADVLPDAIELSDGQGPRLQSVLKKPLEQTLTDAIIRDPHRFAVALYPVIGPAIRRAIGEAMKSVLASVNRAIDTSLSPTARVKAWRAGIPLGEYVLRESLVYRVDDVFLIDPRSGLMIEHVRHPDAGTKDEDAVSAMLTAIQDFVRDSFAGGSEDLNSASVGQYTVWISHGPYAMLAAVIRGAPPADVRSMLDVTVERIHLSHGQALKNFKGGRIGNVDHELAQCLRLKLRNGDTRKPGGLRWPVVLILLAIAGLIAALWWQSFQRDRTLERWRAALAVEPGLVVTETWRQGEQYFASGLRDPLAVEPVDIAAAASIDAAQVSVDFRPFVSLEENMILARARATLSPPGTVEMNLVDGVLVAAGNASAQWRARFETIAPALPGVTSVNAAALTSSDAELFARVSRATQPPDSVQLTVTGGVASFAGEVEAAWIAELPSRLAAVEGLRGSDLRELQSVERQELARLALSINDHRVLYDQGTSLGEIQQQILPSLARKMLEFGRHARALGVQPAFRLVGYTDGLGDPVVNQRLRFARANDLKSRLIARGVNPDWLILRSGPPAPSDDVNNPLRRMVQVEVDSIPGM